MNMTDAPAKISQPTKRQMIEVARNVALTGDWEVSLENSEKFLERFPRDAEALNRKGRALLELGRLQESWDAYSESLSVDPANMIARRNLQRLEMLANTDSTIPQMEEPIASPRGGVFVEEIGKTWVDELTRAADESVLATVSPGEQLTFEVKGSSVIVLSRTGAQLGELEERIARRLIDLVNAGNRYEMYALGMSGHSLRFILREAYRDQSNQGDTGLPRQNRAISELMREREILSQREEADFTFGEDDEDIADEEDAAEDDEDDDIDKEAASYVDTSATDDSEDEM